MTQAAETPTPVIVQRVAKAIEDAILGKPWRHEPGAETHAVAAARAAILAMREPTEAMVTAAWEEQDDTNSAERIWQAMVDAALASPEPDPTLTAGALA